MDCKRVEIREMTSEELSEAIRMNEIVFKINHTMPNSKEYNNLLKELFDDNLRENSQIWRPLQCPHLIA